MYQAIDNQYYLNYFGENGDSMGGIGWSMTEFGWDGKYAGVQVLAPKFLMQGKAAQHKEVFQRFQAKEEYFMCSCIGKGLNPDVELAVEWSPEEKSILEDGLSKFQLRCRTRPYVMLLWGADG